MPVVTTERHVTITPTQYAALLKTAELLTPENVFDYEIERARDKGLDLPRADIDRLWQQIPPIPQMFLVMPRKDDKLDLNGLMALINLHGKTGVNYLDPDDLVDLRKVPAKPHLLLGVEDGRARLNIQPKASGRQIKTEKRIAYSVWHAIIHGIYFPEQTLDDHNMDIVGSRYYGDVPTLSRSEEDGVPELDGAVTHDANPRWGASSGRSIVGL